MKHRPHEELPLIAFGLLTALLVIGQLFKISGLQSTALSSYLAMFAGISSVMVVVRHWRYN